MLGHDKAAAVLGQDPGDKSLCLLCKCERGEVGRDVVEAAFAAAEQEGRADGRGDQAGVERGRDGG